MINYEAHADFWNFINRRHSIFLKKEDGEPKPWTNDPILQSWHFCNPFRQNDKQTRILQDKVIGPHWRDPRRELMLFNIFVYRAFNLHSTYDYIFNTIKTDDHTWIEYWPTFMVIDTLQKYVHTGHTLTSGAYMLRGYEGMPKYHSIPKSLEKVWNIKDQLTDLITTASPTLQGTHNLLVNQKFWGWGPFTCYQIVLDLLYTPILQGATDVNTWCCFGPGAKRGLREIWPDLKLTEPFMLAAAQTLLIDQGKYLEEHVPTMNLQDIEFSLCELQKYRRIKNGGRAKEKYNGRN